MTQDEARRAALDELLHISDRELHWLLISDNKLFGNAPAVQWMRPLDAEPDLAEAIDAFCARFSRLQDTLGDKLLAIALKTLREPTGGFLDNLSRAERAGLVPSERQFVAARDLRNRFAHDYSSKPAVLASLLDEAHALVPVLADTQRRLADVLRV